nr:hypothetical protein [uncultured Psychroserpens sp.]
MKTVHLKQHWKGYFTYLEGYETIEQYKQVEFTMEITLTDNSFIGTSTDAESRHAFDEPATVKGFIDDEKISFVMKYPCSYYKDDFRKIQLDKSSQHPDIHYLGFFDNDKKTVSGNWEITIFIEQTIEGDLEDVSNGEFEMSKIN